MLLVSCTVRDLIWHLLSLCVPDPPVDVVFCLSCLFCVCTSRCFGPTSSCFSRHSLLLPMASCAIEWYYNRIWIQLLGRHNYCEFYVHCICKQDYTPSGYTKYAMFVYGHRLIWHRGLARMSDGCRRVKKNSHRPTRITMTTARRSFEEQCHPWTGARRILITIVIIMQLKIRSCHAGIMIRCQIIDGALKNCEASKLLCYTPCYDNYSAPNDLFSQRVTK